MTEAAHRRSNQTRSIGQDRVRVDGRLKVTGTAPYAYEQTVENPTYLYPLVSEVARGKITRIDASAAESLSGVLLVLTHENTPKLLLKSDPEMYILQGDEVQFKGQFIGAVVAETPDIARHAASLVRVSYERQDFDAEFIPEHPDKFAAKLVNLTKPATTKEGQPDEAFAAAPVQLDEIYETSSLFHNPLETHTTIATWHDEQPLNPKAKRLTLLDANQGTGLIPLMLAPLLGVLPGQIEVVSPFTGGSFGSKWYPHSHLVLVALAAKLLPGRPVKFTLTRQQMFSLVGYRPASHQHLRLGADADGKLSAALHDSTGPTAKLKTYVDATCVATRMMYDAPNVSTSHLLVPLDIAVGTYMRAPGEFSGMFALETAIDELAEKLGLDPIELRLLNEPEKDPETGHSWSSRRLRECLQEGARRFGWEKRGPVGSRVEGEWQYGLGVAAGTYPDQHMLNTKARIRFEGGRYKVELQASDIGTGAYTILGQIAADALKVDVALVDVELGHTGLPFAMTAGGSMGTYTWGSSIMVAAVKFRDKYGDQPHEGASMTASGVRPRDFKKYSRHTFAAHFAEVKVSRVTGEVRVPRLLGVYDAGRIINPRTANSQFVGGMTMGLSAALHEESYLDPRFGHTVNSDLAGYHIAAHADVMDIQAHWLEGFDDKFGPTGAKGIGEIGVVGTPAAIGNAIYNATGKRLRRLPFAPQDLL